MAVIGLVLGYLTLLVGIALVLFLVLGVGLLAFLA